MKKEKPTEKPSIEKVSTRGLIRSLRVDLERQRRKREKELASEKQQKR
jgi:hypothetical protein